MRIIVKKFPVYRELSEAFARYHQEELAAFLDSSLAGKLGRYSILGLRPYAVFLEKEGRCYRDGAPISEAFELALQKFMEENREENPTDLPMIAGAIGYFSYDYGRKFEKLPSRHRERVKMPEALFAFYDWLLVEDKERRELFACIGGRTMEPEAAFAQLEAELADCPKQEALPKGGALASYESSFTQEEYQEAVGRMMDYIVEGDIYIANMTQQLRVKSDADPYRVFRYLRQHNPSPFGGYFNYGDFQVVCASPERFLQIKGGRVETRPIKGTRKRGETQEEDEALRQELVESEKDRSELLMIVDLERNDFSRVCAPGSVNVTEQFAVEAYATVFHLVTTVEGRLKEGLNAMDLIPAAFPGGSITGAPKIRAMEIIDELERDRRGLYTGSLGYLSLDGNCDLNIVIRTAVYREGMYYLGVGGGITCESEPEFEYEETLQKAKAVLAAIAAGGEV